MAFLYAELPARAKASLNEHLQACAECRTQVARWQLTMKNLADWPVTIPTAAQPVSALQPVLKWGLAAALALLLGIAIGRLATPATDTEAWRVAMEQSLRSSLADEIRQQVHDELRADWLAALRGQPQALNTAFRRELQARLDQWSGRVLASANAENQRLLAVLTESIEANREQDYQALLTLLDRSEQRRQADHLNLRRALETVAVVAADKFQRTESELGQLASFTRANFTPDDSNQPFRTETPANRKGTK
jgi:hypothetical protein